MGQALSLSFPSVEIAASRPAMLRLRLVCGAFVGALLLTACPPSGIVCRAGTERCGLGCADLAHDKRNCGGCGIACGVGQDCFEVPSTGPDAGVTGECRCQEGTAACGGECVVIQSDARHCGGCGMACASGLVCQAGQCAQSCTLGVTERCGSGCVDTRTDVRNCGGCGVACDTGQSCRAGRCTFDVVAACLSTGQSRGLSSTEAAGALRNLGNAPVALAQAGDTLLALDATDRRLYQAALFSTVPSQVLGQHARFNSTGAAPNHVVVRLPYVFVLNSEAATLQVLKVDAPGGLVLDAGLGGGLALGTVAELAFGANTYPEVLVPIGANDFWVPLYGGQGAQADAGQKLVRVDVTSPEAPRLSTEVPLGGLPLPTFDGGEALPRPYAATARGGVVYVALNNLRPACSPFCDVAGPGALARYVPADAGLSLIALGAECLNPVWVSAEGDWLVVSCAGRAEYDSNFLATATFGAGLALLDGADVVRGRWTLDCQVDAGCVPFTPGRLALKGGKLYVSDQNFGRLAVLDVADGGLSDGGLVVRRGQGGAQPALTVCPPQSGSNVSNVADVLVVP